MLSKKTKRKVRKIKERCTLYPLPLPRWAKFRLSARARVAELLDALGL